MKEVPARLQCAYCLRNQTHGGECRRNKYDDIGCLAFSPDPRGCIRNEDGGFYIPLFHGFPPINTWRNDWTLDGINAAKIRIRQIKGIDWDKKGGHLILYCNYDYYINEYHEDYKDSNKKPKLKVIK